MTTKLPSKGNITGWQSDKVSSERMSGATCVRKRGRRGDREEGREGRGEGGGGSAEETKGEVEGKT
jgi:hypothetical protein